MKMSLLEDISTGATVSLLNADINTYKIIFEKGAVNQEYVNLFRASSLLYCHLQGIFDFLEKEITYAENLGVEQGVPTLLKIQSAIKLAQETAIGGIESYKKRLPK